MLFGIVGGEANVFALTSGEDRETVMLELIYSILLWKKVGLGTARYPVCVLPLGAPPWTHRCRQDMLFGPRFFCGSFNTPPSLPKLSSPLGLILWFQHEELCLNRSS